MYQRIYEQLAIGQSAIYQIKFKGTLPSSLTNLGKRFRVTIETSDVRYPVTMLTGELSKQSELLAVLNALHNAGHSIISMACIEVVSGDDNQVTV